MNTIEIDKALANVPGFLGAHPFDSLPKKRTTDFSIVINTDSKKGEHWLGLVRKNNIYYFHDSYGRKPGDLLFTKQFRTTMRKYINAKCISNTKWIQQITSNVCGMHSIYFIKEMQLRSFKKILSVFDNNLKNNDKYVVRYYKKYN